MDSHLHLGSSPEFIFSPSMSRDTLLGMEIPLDSLEMLKCLSLLSV